MPTLIDSHCHLDRLDLTPFDGSLDRAIAQAAELDIKEILCVSVERETIQNIIGIAEKYSNVYASVGQHPSEEEENLSAEDLVHLANHPKVIAIGETGLDYYYEHTNRDFQKERFITHIEASKKCAKPLIIHTRSAQEDTLQILRDFNVSQAVFHCFTESWEMAKAGIDLGLYISFSGILTFKNAESLREVAKKVPLDRILVETDAPYLTPVPFRGKPNCPGYTRYVAECLAELKGIPYSEVAQKTTENFYRLFGLQQKG